MMKRERAKCRTCGKLIAVVGPFYDPAVAYTFKDTTYSGHRIIAPGHWGYNYYFVHEDKHGNVLRATMVPARFHTIIRDSIGELKDARIKAALL